MMRAQLTRTLAVALLSAALATQGCATDQSPESSAESEDTFEQLVNEAALVELGRMLGVGDA